MEDWEFTHETILAAKRAQVEADRATVHMARVLNVQFRHLSGLELREFRSRLEVELRDFDADTGRWNK